MAIGCGSGIHDDLVRMKATHFCEGDIVILCINLEIVPEYLFKENGIVIYDCSNLFHRSHMYGEWFTDMTPHTNEKGNEVIARYIFDSLKQQNLISCKNESSFNDNVLVDRSENYIDKKEIEKYLLGINKCWCHESVCGGGIVMNCNPFTLGHLYLIETAAAQVDHLFIFIVEENKSCFPFEDRIELVRRGTEHIKNICIVPSGKYIISAITFPGYFYKDGNTEIEVDTSKDIHIFGKYIAPGLGISRRFVGEEPNDYVTRKYNETMKEILPLYNVQVIEIPRKKKCGNVISASLVRKYLENKDFDSIRKIVPKTTFDYLLKNYD